MADADDALLLAADTSPRDRLLLMLVERVGALESALGRVESMLQDQRRMGALTETEWVCASWWATSREWPCVQLASMARVIAGWAKRSGVPVAEVVVFRDEHVKTAGRVHMRLAHGPHRLEAIRELLWRGVSREEQEQEMRGFDVGISGPWHLSSCAEASKPGGVMWSGHT